MAANKNVSILVVDDEQLIRTALRDVLSSQGYDVAMAGSARAGLEALAGKGFELLLSDINMPGEDGVWLLGEVKERYPDMAVVMLTGVDDVKTAVGCLRKGASDYIKKPFRMDEVLGAVMNALDKRRLVLENRAYQRSLESMVRQRTKQLDQALEDLEFSYMATLEALIAALDAREHETQNHSRRVQLYTVGIARAYGISEERLGDVARGSLLHDIGKIGVSDNILLKPAKLTAEEWVDMRRHPEIGFEILRGIPYFENATRIVRYHHEKWDGTGYPFGIGGNDIPVEARLFAVADTFDAMTSDRVYRRAQPPANAVEELLRFSGTQFDPAVVTCFVDNLDRIVRDVSPHLVTEPAPTLV